MTNATDLMISLPDADRIRHVIEYDEATYEELDEAVSTITRMMARLMSVRESLLIRMRKTGRIR